MKDIFKMNTNIVSPILIVILVTATGSLVNGQARFTISGKITDGESGEVLIGATVHIPALNTGTVANNYGFFSLTLNKADSISCVISFLGYAPQIKEIYLTRNIRLDVELISSNHTLDEVLIYSRQADENVQGVQMAVIDIPIKKVKELPAIFGEIDALKIIQLLPGVQSGNEGTTGFYVRGGNVDQNLVQLDEATVYNPNHLLGLFSTFNVRALNNITLIKGGFPAQYGGRLSSILDISMKEGNNRKFRGEGGIGLISSNLSLEGPIKKEKASFIFSARRTYLDLLVRPFLASGNKSNYHFYDLNAKVNWKLSGKDHIYLSVFRGQDKAAYLKSNGINYIVRFGNATGTMRWNHLFTPKLFVNTSLLYNQYDQDISAYLDNFYSQTITGISDLNSKIEFQYFPNPAHSIRYGSHYIYHTFASGGQSVSRSLVNKSIDISNVPHKYFHEYAFYINDEIKLSEKLSTSLGLRAPGFVSKNAHYFRIEPWVSAKIAVGGNSSIKGSYTMMNQFLHLIPSATATIPTDVWIPTTNRTKPQKSIQYALGYFRNFTKNTIESSLEFYYKDMSNQVLFPEGNQLVENFDIDSTLVYGKGWSYGSELFIKKNEGKLTGWISYTLSWTYQQFDKLNYGKKFPFRYDRRHVVSLVATYELSPKWTISGIFVYNSGNAYTLPAGRFVSSYGPSLFEGNYLVYESRNNARLSDYHRLDLSAIYRKKTKLFGLKYDAEWVFSVYNVYSRQNPYFVYLKVDPKTDKPQARQVSLLPVIPSVTYNFKF